MKSRSIPFASVLLTLLLIASPALAATTNTDIDTTEANKKLVLDFFRVVFEAENADAAKDYLTEGYIQHNPKVPTGRDGFINYFKPKFKGPKPIKDQLEKQPEKILAEGDFVILMYKTPQVEPTDKNKIYDAYWFDMFRIENGKIAEHWDCAKK